MRDLRPERHGRRVQLVGGRERRGRAARPTLEKQYRARSAATSRAARSTRAARPDDADERRARRDVGAAGVRRRLRERFPVPGWRRPPRRRDSRPPHRSPARRPGGDPRPDRGRPARRAGRVGAPARVPARRAAGEPAGPCQAADPDAAHRRRDDQDADSGSVARAQPVARVRGRLPDRSARSCSASRAPRPARSRRVSATDLRSLVEGPANGGGPGHDPRRPREPRRRGARPASREPARRGARVRPRIRLVLGQPPARFSQERLGAAYHGTCWALGREAAAILPLEPLLGSAVRVPWSWQAATLRRSLEAVAPHLAHEARVILLLEHGGPEALAAAVLGGVGAGYRLVEARLTDPDDEVGGVVELVPPGGVPAAGAAHPRQRPPASPPGQPWRPRPRARAGPVRAARADRRAAVLGARGGPLDLGDRRRGPPGSRRTGALRAAARRDPRRPRSLRPAAPPRGPGAASIERGHAAERPMRPASRRGTPSRTSALEAPDPGGAGRVAAAVGAGGFDGPGPAIRQSLHRQRGRPRDPVERVLALVRDELSRPASDRVVEIEPGRWWLGDRAIERRRPSRSPTASSGPSTASCRPPGRSPSRRSSSASRRCSPATTCPTRRSSARASRATGARPRPRTGWSPTRTSADAPRSTRSSSLDSRTAAIGSACTSGSGGATRPAASGIGPSATTSTSASASRGCPRRVPGAGRGRRGRRLRLVPARRLGFLFEVEWTAMLGDVLLRRHARIPTEDGSSGSLPDPARAAELARHKLESSPVLREAMEAGQLAPDPVAPPRRLAGPRAARPRRPGAVPRARSADRAPRRADGPLRSGRALDRRTHRTGPPAIRNHQGDVLPQQSSAVDQLADGFWERFKALSPISATVNGDTRYDDRLPDPSPAGREQYGARSRRISLTPRRRSPPTVSGSRTGSPWT